MSEAPPASSSPPSSGPRPLPPGVCLRPVTAADVPVLLSLIRELAEYERLAHAVVANEAGLAAALFGPRPACEAVLAEQDGQPIGFALYFQSFSTFVGKPGLYLEDLFVKPAFRGRGVGRALFTHVAGVAVQRGCGRFEWTALEWNTPALDFYKRFGAVVMDEWRLLRLSGEALARAGSQAPR